MPNTKPTLLSQRMANQALADPAFFSKVPEFLGLKAQLATMKAKLEKPGGCSSCRKRRIVRNVYGDFMATFMALSPDGISRMKNYFGVDKFMIHAREQTTGKAVVKIV